MILRVIDKKTNLFKRDDFTFDNETKIYTPATALGNYKVAFVKVSGVYNSAMFGETITTKFCAVTTGAGKGVTALNGSFVKITRLN